MVSKLDVETEMKSQNTPQNNLESVVKVHWILQMGEINPNKIDV